MVGSLEVFLIFLLLGVLGVASWWLAISLRYGAERGRDVYARGANFDPGPGKAKGSVRFSCPSGRRIRVKDAVVVCSGPGRGNVEASPTPPFLSDGTLNAKNTKDVKKGLSELADGKEAYVFSFDGARHLPGCKVRGLVRPQLIATYLCSP